MIQTLQLNPLNNVVANGVANLDLQNSLGFTIKSIWLALGGTLTAAMITSIQLKANGKIIVDTDGAKLAARNAYKGTPTPVGFVCLDFTEQLFFSPTGYLGGALDTTLGIKSLRLELTIAGATAPTISAFALVGPPQTNDSLNPLRPLIARVHRVQQTIGAAGSFPLAIPHMQPNEGGSIFKRTHVFSANMTGYRVQKNGITEYELLKAQNDALQAFYRRTPQAGLFVLDHVLEKLQGDSWDTRPAVQSTTTQFLATFNAAETITVEVEVLEPLDVY